MKIAELLEIAAAAKDDYHNLRRRGLLSVADFDPTDPENRYGRRYDYTLEEAAELRVMLDLIGTGLRGEDAQNFVLNGFGRVKSGNPEIGQVAQSFSQLGRGVIITREIYRADWVSQDADTPRDFTVTWWSGTREEVDLSIARANAAGASSHRRTVGRLDYDLSLTVEECRKRAHRKGIEV